MKKYKAMNILFLTVGRFNVIEEHGIYTDLMREFIDRGHIVYIVSPVERRFKKATFLRESDTCKNLKVRTLNIQKTNVIEKGIGTLLLERQFKKAIKHYWKNISFDLILYATPPITLNKVIKNIKRKNKAISYLMLKDIFPQNAVDLGMFSKRSFLYRMFRKKEKELYRISDFIGCMSPANVRYILNNNCDINPSKIEVCPNSITPGRFEEITNTERTKILTKFNIPTDKVISVYGGNLGKPQGIDFLLDVIKSNETRNNSFMIIVGSGTEYDRIKTWFETNQPNNSILLPSLPRDEYSNLTRCSDIGMIFLDHRFTIPNYPSRLLAYLEAGIPIITASDPNCDTGIIAEENGYGLKTMAGDIVGFNSKLDLLIENPSLRKEMGKRGRKYLEDNYTSSHTADIILKSINKTPYFA